MAITQKNLKILWGNAASRCSFTNCQCRLCTDDAGASAPYTLGEMAHICGEKPGANRYDRLQTAEQRDGYDNLVLLCPNHHTLIDRPEDERRYSADELHRMKSEHEKFVSERLEPQEFTDKRQVAERVYPLLKENHQVWLSYGPQSEIARRNPESEAHAIWLSERLATIIPNNRLIAKLTSDNSGLFTADEQAIFKKFEIHQRSCEQWVHDEINYEGVVRFPPEFDTLISEVVHAGA
jgi:hypothetical protein